MAGKRPNQFRRDYTMEIQLDRHSQTTLFEQIYTRMLDRMYQGEWPPGTKLPSQRKLAEQLGVNRSTIIDVLDELKAEGWLESKTGSGTYVAHNSWQTLFPVNITGKNGYEQAFTSLTCRRSSLLMNMKQKRSSAWAQGNYRLASSRRNNWKKCCNQFRLTRAQSGIQSLKGTKRLDMQ